MKPAIAGMLAAGLIAAAAPQANAALPSKFDCEANLMAAGKAADAAVRLHQDLDKAVAGVVVGGSCIALSLAVGFTDGGALTAVCGAATALAVVATPATANAAVAMEAYTQVRDPRCIAGQ